MQNFVFHNPTKILFGRGTIPQVGQEAAAYGKRILLVYGQGSIKKNGVYQQVMEALAGAGLEVIEYGGVKSNPVLDYVRKGIALAKLHKIEAVVAAGGGSVIDSAKAIGTGALVDHDVWQFFKGKKPVKATLPVICILTLAAAGSEMNSGMVLTNETTRQKFGIGNKCLYPKVSILDPETTFSVPSNYTAYGAIDALAHMLEFYFTTADSSTQVQDRLIEGLAINIIENCNIALREPKNYAARSNLLWCSTLALNGLTAAGLGKVGFPMHMIEHSLSALYDIPHGAGLSVVMPGWMEWAADKIPARLSQFAERVFAVRQGSMQAKAGQAINLLRDWFTEVNSPTTLTKLGLTAEQIPAIAENSLMLARLWRLHDYNRDTIEAILHRCL